MAMAAKKSWKFIKPPLSISKIANTGSNNTIVINRLMVSIMQTAKTCSITVIACIGGRFRW